jgi:hypothetical protein
MDWFVTRPLFNSPIAMDHSQVTQQSATRRISPATALEVSDLEEDSFITQKRDDLRRACLVNLISFVFGSISDWGREQRQQFNDFLDETQKSFFEPPELYLRPYETRHFATVARLCRSRACTAAERLMHALFILADTVPFRFLVFLEKDGDPDDEPCLHLQPGPDRKILSILNAMDQLEFLGKHCPELEQDLVRQCRATPLAQLERVLDQWEVEPVLDDEQDQEAPVKRRRPLHLSTLREWIRRVCNEPEARDNAEACPPAGVEGAV